MIRSQLADGRPLIGSGYLLNERIVITAAHLLEDSADLSVRRLGEDDWTDGRPVWMSAAADMALVELLQPALSAVILPTRWARIDGADPVSCTAIGFPRFQSAPDGQRDSEQILGDVLPLSGRVSGRLNFVVRTPAAVPGDAVSSPWAGMAGAALFAGDYMVGVIVQASATGNTRLLAADIRPLAEDTAAAALIAPSGGELAVIGVGSGAAPQPAVSPASLELDLSPFSPSMHGVITGLGLDSQVTASAIAEALQHLHPEYAGSLFGAVNLDATAGQRRTLREWLAVVRDAFDLDTIAASDHPDIGGRLVIKALAVLDPDLAAALGTDVVTRLAKERPIAPTLPPPESSLREHVRWVIDDPVDLSNDQLGRAAVAHALELQLVELVKIEDGRSFLVHIDGAWGAGKSTLLRFLRELVDPPRKPASPGGRRSHGRWLVISYDAWRQSRAGPPWLTLLSAVRNAVRAEQRGWRARAKFWLMERVLLLSAWQLVAMMLLLIVGVVAIITLLVSGNGLGMGRAGSFLQLLGSLTTVLATGWLLTASAGRFITLDSRRAARAFIETRPDPMEDLARHFSWMLRYAGKTVLVLIDDLDRCPDSFVVDLLDAVQKLMRDRDPSPGKQPPKPLLIVVAADGRWIQQSYDTAYASASATIREPGATIGSLFLKKIFQLTMPVPRLSEDLKAEYLADLLAGHARSSSADPQLEERLRQAPRSAVLDVLAAASPVERVRAAGAAIDRLVTEPGARADTEHALERYAPLLAPTPRAMKRFIMNYSMLRAVRTAEGSVVGRGPLALWTILRNRWPVLADYLQEHPEGVTLFQQPAEHFSDSVPPTIVPLFTDPPDSLRAVMNHPDGPLTAEVIQECCGQLIPPAASINL
jgi:KAP family P-loop domain